MKKAAVIQDFLEAHAKRELTKEILNNLADALRSTGKKGAPEHKMRQIWMLALRSVYTADEQSALTGKTVREVKKYAQKAKEAGWEAINVSQTAEGNNQVWMAGRWEWYDESIVLVFTFKVLENQLLTQYFRIA